MKQGKAAGELDTLEENFFDEIDKEQLDRTIH